jgi:hypothetical protein
LVFFAQLKVQVGRRVLVYMEPNVFGMRKLDQRVIFVFVFAHVNLMRGCQQPKVVGGALYGEIVDHAGVSEKIENHLETETHHAPVHRARLLVAAACRRTSRIGRFPRRWKGTSIVAFVPTKHQL